MKKVLVIGLLLFGMFIVSPAPNTVQAQCAPSLTSTPNPSTVGQTVNFSGACYFPKSGETFVVHIRSTFYEGDQDVAFFNVNPTTAGDIAFSYTFNTTGSRGILIEKARQSGRSPLVVVYFQDVN